MPKRDVVWIGVAVTALAVSGLLAWWIRSPSLGVKAQLELDDAMEALARDAGTRDGVFPERWDGGTDPWGRPYRYEREAPHGPVRLWSVGADGIDQHGAGDDIASWTR